MKGQWGLNLIPFSLVPCPLPSVYLTLFALHASPVPVLPPPYSLRSPFSHCPPPNRASSPAAYLALTGSVPTAVWGMEHGFVSASSTAWTCSSGGSMDALRPDQRFIGHCYRPGWGQSWRKQMIHVPGSSRDGACWSWSKQKWQEGRWRGGGRICRVGEDGGS